MKIAIKANPTRGKEIISLLESLGGNTISLSGDGEFYTYYIDENNVIRYNNAPKGYKVYTLEEFEKEFPFKVGDLCIYHSDIHDENIIVKILGMAIKDNCIMYEVGHKDFTKKHSYIYRERETLKPYKEMNTRNVTLTLDKAKEWYKKGGDLKQVALQAFTEEELTKLDLPKTWEEFCRNYIVQTKECWLNERGIIEQPACSGSRKHKNWIPSKKSAEAHLAMIQLEQLRDCWRQGWKPNWNDGMQIKYCVCCIRGKFKINILCDTSQFLSFPTMKMAEEFLKCFRDLIEKAGDLI